MPDTPVLADGPAPSGDLERRERILDPLARVSEILFGVIMALTFTTTLDAASGGREEIRTLLYAVVGCNLAWGLVDAAMYLMSVLTSRGRGLLAVRAVRAAGTAEHAHRLIADAMPPLLAALLTTDDLERLRQGLTRLEDPPAGPRMVTKDWLGALSVFLLVFVSTFPIVVPFLVFGRAQVALRVSNAVAIVMLFGCGSVLGRYGGYRPWTTGLILVALGVVLVAITIALGG